ncbi:SURF1 family protein [Kribbella sp. NPDC006257]|uniref:SURF1 family protein n=1 Tax=Kribbella sp. NPDC006257 TaxID=3156738 RepID=UPI0033B6BD4F
MPVAPTTETPVPVTQPARPLWRTILTPRWLGLLALALAIAAVMSVLGVWQLDVYHSKTAKATAARAAGAPVPLQSLFSINDGLPSKAVGRRVTVTGTWGPAADQLYISDRRLGDRNGFWVVTPLLLDGTDPGPDVAAPTSGAVMIVRGWVPTPSHPAAKPPAGRVNLTGSVVSSEAQDASGDDTKSRILQSLRIPTIVHLVNYRLYDAFVVMSSATPTSPTSPTPASPTSPTPASPTPASADAPAIVPPPAPPTDHAGLRNVAYAFQWWIFALFTLWMWNRMVRDAHRDPATN